MIFYLAMTKSCEQPGGGREEPNAIPIVPPISEQDL